MGTITKDMRKQIAEEVASLTFKEKVQAWMKQDHALMQAVIEKAYPKKIRDAMAALEVACAKDYPEDDVFTNLSELNLAVGGYYLQIGSSHNCDKTRDPKFGYKKMTVKVLKCHGHSRKMINLGAGDQFGQKIQAHCDARDALNEEISLAIRDVIAVLSKIRTDKQCRTQWPEIIPIVDNLMPEAKVPNQLPATLRMELNGRLQLPPKDYPAVEADLALAS